MDPCDVKRELPRKGINHRLIGLMGDDAEEAEENIYRIRGKGASKEVVESVIRAWRLGAHVVEHEMRECIWSEKITGACGTQGPPSEKGYINADVRTKRAEVMMPGARVPRGKVNASPEQSTCNALHNLIALRGALFAACSWEARQGCLSMNSHSNQKTLKACRSVDDALYKNR